MRTSVRELRARIPRRPFVQHASPELPFVDPSLAFAELVSADELGRTRDAQPAVTLSRDGGDLDRVGVHQPLVRPLIGQPMPIAVNPHDHDTLAETADGSSALDGRNR